MWRQSCQIGENSVFVIMAPSYNEDCGPRGTKMNFIKIWYPFCRQVPGKKDTKCPFLQKWYPCFVENRGTKKHSQENFLKQFNALLETQEIAITLIPYSYIEDPLTQMQCRILCLNL